jgi:hypothetical protein
MALVVRDVWSPSRDPVRSDGLPEHTDDPGGGVLDTRGPDSDRVGVVLSR